MPDDKIIPAEPPAQVIGNNFGLRGVIWSNIGNMSAMAVICVVFIWQQQDSIQQSREDRTMFREEIKALRESQVTRWEKTDITHGRAMDRIGEKIERAMTSLDNAVKELRDTNRRMTISPPVVQGGAGVIHP